MAEKEKNKVFRIFSVILQYHLMNTPTMAISKSGLKSYVCISCLIFYSTHFPKQSAHLNKARYDSKAANRSVACFFSAHGL